MTLQNWFASLPKAAPDLFRSIYDFNTRPQDWVHPSLLEGLPHAKVVEFLSREGVGRKLTGRWIFSQFAVQEDETFWDFEEPRRRLALLDWKSLDEISRYCGATLRWSQIKSIISRSDLQRLKARLGGEVHSFALQRGPLLKAPKGLSSMGESHMDENFAESVWMEGWSMVLRSLAGESDALLKRFRLKLPPDVRNFYPDPGPLPAEVRDGTWRFVRRIAEEILSDRELQCFA